MKQIIWGWHILVLVICLSLSVTYWWYGRSHDQTNVKELASSASFLESNMEQYVEHLEDYAKGIAALYEASNEVEPQELSQYVSKVLDENSYSEILRISFVERVATKNIPAWEKRFSSDNEIPFTAQVVPSSEDQFLIKTVVDATGKIYQPSGKNHLADAERSKAIELMRGGSKVVVSYVSSIVNVSEYSGSGVFVIVPIYRDGEWIGYINMVLSSEGLMNKMRGLVGNSRIKSWAIGQQEIYKGEALGKAEIELLTTVDLPDSNAWNVVVAADNSPGKYWELFLEVSIVGSLMMAIMIYMVGATGRRAVTMADLMTLELRQYKAALDSSNNHVVITDPEGMIVYANAAAQKLTGFGIKEMIGNTPRLWGRQMPLEFYEKMWQKIKTERSVFQGELKNKKKSGEIYNAYANIAPIIDQKTSQLVGFVGIEQDITERTKLIDELTKKNNELAKLMDLTVEREDRIRQLKEKLAGKGESS